MKDIDLEIEKKYIMIWNELVIKAQAGKDCSDCDTKFRALLSQQKEELEKVKIKKLRLKRGDILQAPNQEIAYELTKFIHPYVDCAIPIIVGDVRKLNKEELEYLKELYK